MLETIHFYALKLNDARFASLSHNSRQERQQDNELIVWQKFTSSVRDPAFLVKCNYHTRKWCCGCVVKLEVNFSYELKNKITQLCGSNELLTVANGEHYIWRSTYLLQVYLSNANTGCINNRKLSHFVCAIYSQLLWAILLRKPARKYLKLASA